MNIDNTQAGNGRKYGTAYLTFMNLKGSAYKKGNLIVGKTLVKESKTSPLCKLAEFTDMVIEDCALNESKTGMNVSVCVNAVGEENMKKLYEWLKKYTNEDKISEIAPGLLESLGITAPSEQKIDEESSVASRFSKYRKLYESDDDEEETDDNKDEPEKTDDNSTGESKDEPEDSEDPEKEEEDEEEELTAVIIEVKKGDEEAAKQEMIDAGVDEDDIEILKPEGDEEDEDNTDDNEEKPENESGDEDGNEDEPEEDSDETVKIKVSIDSFDALKEYLEGKGFDLEEELGGEIVTDDKDEDEDEDAENDKEKDELEDTFNGFDDLFGDMGDDSEDKEKK